jgi:hypothetical protein
MRLSTESDQLQARAQEAAARRGSRQCQSRLGRGRPRPRPAIPAASEDIPTTSVCKSDLPNIIEVFVGGVHACVIGLL